MISTFTTWTKGLLCLMIAFSAALPHVFAQGTPLTMEEAIRTALANNRDLQLTDIDEKTAAARYRETQAVFLPQVQLSYSAMTTNLPLNAFAFKLQQASVGEADFAPDLLNHPGAVPDFLTSVDIKQPILNLDQLFQRKSAAVAVDIYRLQTQRTREGLIFRVDQAYMQLQLAMEAVRVLSSSLATADSLYRYTKDRAAQGILSKADELNAAIQVTTIQTRLAVARSAVQNGSDALGLLMGMPAGREYRIADQLAVLDVRPADTVVPAGRSDLAAMQKAVEAAQLGIRSTRTGALPRLNAFGTFQYNDHRMFGFGAHGYLAGLQLSWDIFRGNGVKNRAATQQLQLNRLQTERTSRKEQSDAELRRAERSLDDAGYAIKQARAAIGGATESYRILRDRYEQGLAGSTDVLLAQDRLQTQQLALAQAVFEQNVAFAYIRFLTADQVSK